MGRGERRRNLGGHHESEVYGEEDDGNVEKNGGDNGEDRREEGKEGSGGDRRTHLRN